jgi:putative membrane protein
MEAKEDQAMRILTLAIVGAGAALAPAAASAQQAPGVERYYYGPPMMGWDGGWSMVFGPLVMIVTLAVVVAFAVLLARWIGGPWPGSPHIAPQRTALDILKERYARGEIDKAEFEERRRVIGD